MGKNIKLALRYVIIAFVMFIVYKVIQPSYIKEVADQQLLQVVVVAVFGALTLILKFMFEQGVDE